MAKGKPGADSAAPVTTQVLGQGLIQLAQSLYGEMPVFWGRYFTSTSGSSFEYRHLKENQPLRDNQIRVLPIARQTGNVNGTHAQGSADAERNADDLIATFGAPYLATLSGQFYMFLDVEGNPRSAWWNPREFRRRPFHPMTAAATLPAPAGKKPCGALIPPAACSSAISSKM